MSEQFATTRKRSNALGAGADRPEIVPLFSSLSIQEQIDGDIELLPAAAFPPTPPPSPEKKFSAPLVSALKSSSKRRREEDETIVAEELSILRRPIKKMKKTVRFDMEEKVEKKVKEDDEELDVTFALEY